MTDQRIKEMLEKLFDMAAGNLAGSQIQAAKKAISRGKLFELRVLLEILGLMKFRGYRIRAVTVKPNELRFPLSPATADKSKYSYFEALDRSGTVVYEIWVGVQVSTLSKERFELAFPAMSPFGGKAAIHEIDVAVFDKLAVGNVIPSFRSLCFGASCKSNAIGKEQLREALGLRRETALLVGERPSEASWFRKSVPADPASPLVLFSADKACLDYKDPVESLGVYIRYLQFP